ncbi:MAG: aldolase [Methanoculleaceae archaeon]
MQIRELYGYEFARIGRLLIQENLVSGNSGNMSVRQDDGFLITRHGSYPGRFYLPVYVRNDAPVPKEASSEYLVHRKVYEETEHQAIVHAHPPYAVALSLSVNEAIRPVDVEGMAVCREIPVVEGPPGSGELSQRVSDALIDSRAVIVSGHGTFCGGESLDEAYLITSKIEHACHVLILSRLFRRA